VDTDLITHQPVLSLEQNLPNPFNPTTTINFSLPRQQHVTIAIYDILGRRVAILVDKRYERGRHSVVWNASKVPSGIYIYVMTTATSTLTKKMVLIK
jgi:flagellar hook assembly protein FlgD